jgi:hypothetical protein
MVIEVRCRPIGHESIQIAISSLARSFRRKKGRHDNTHRGCLGHRLKDRVQSTKGEERTLAAPNVLVFILSL